ncbi:rab-GTPase-TBC domain-containing protein [Cristinia sonorae]|uniref:Rab-GTPase-TBC domain-containing protein n=1 Tax=Cristinia sonorae TaxID=1940300 RepID=A0A8K0XUV8_9AGAR|nr:rab-GTPase-TBC domain-containing protein [Cristinia sonorae]
MAARPPPARPHIGLNPSPRFSSYSTSEWVDDDAWDSGSDSESPTKTSWKQPTSKHASSSSPKPVPKSGQNNSSSSTLASSYTHLHAPSPSSYPPRPEQPQPVNKNGWTIVSKSTDRLRGADHDESAHTGDGAAGAEGDGSDLILGDLDPEVAEQPAPAPSKPRQDQGSLRDDVDEIVNDPLHLIRRRPPKRNHSLPSSSEPGGQLARERSIKSNRRQKFVGCIMQEDVNMAQLRKLAWNGVPSDLRPVTWPLLLGYMPLPAPLRASTLARKRQEYLSLVELAFARNREGLDQQIWHQIEIDVPRTRPGVKLWMQASTQRSLERILYVWAIRHPASGYVQGINDLATPFFQVFLSAYIDSDPEEFDPTLLPSHVLNAIEADSFWCLSRLLDGIQDNYIATQPGIQRSVKRMTELVARIDPPLAAHLESENVEFMQFAFRWMNCLLMREISVENTIRMWDTYLAEGADAFSQFHLYVCSAFLVQWSKKLREMDFQGIIMFLQSLPTQGWTDHEIEMLLSEAFVHYSTWHNAQSHFGK